MYYKITINIYFIINSKSCVFMYIKVGFLYFLHFFVAVNMIKSCSLEYIRFPFHYQLLISTHDINIGVFMGEQVTFMTRKFRNN